MEHSTLLADMRSISLVYRHINLPGVPGVQAPLPTSAVELIRLLGPTAFNCR